MRPIPEFTAADIARFWEKVDKNGPVPAHMPHLGNCWVWTSTIGQDGYGKFWLKGGQRRAHRVAWKMEFGDAATDALVMHRCDHRLCCRPSHMSLGTPLLNMRDMISKGRKRVARGDRNGSRTCIERMPRGESHYLRKHPERVLRGGNHPNRINPAPLARGEHHGRAKLQEVHVLQIRDAYSAGAHSKAELARQFGVTQTSINNILTRRNWRHI